MFGRYLTVLILLACSCSSPPLTNWNSVPSNEEMKWRQFQLFQGEHAHVWASNEEAAAEAHDFIARARAAVATPTQPPAGISLVIVLCKQDDPLFEGVEDYENALRKWGSTSNLRIESSHSRGGDGKQPDFDARLALSLASVAVPVDDSDLNLPEALAPQFSHALIMSSNDRIEWVCQEMVDASLAASDAGWLERKLLLAAMNPTAQMVEKMTPGLRSAFVQSWASIHGLTKEQVNLARAEFGLAAMGPQSESRRKRAPHLLTHDRAMEIILSSDSVVLDEELGFGVRASPSSYCFFAMQSMDWGLIFDLNPKRSDKAGALEGYPHYEWLPLTNEVPTKGDVEAFEKLRLQYPGFTLVLNDNVSQAATFLAAHAFWVQEVDASTALEFGAYFGMTSDQGANLRKAFLAD